MSGASVSTPAAERQHKGRQQHDPEIDAEADEEAFAFFEERRRALIGGGLALGGLGGLFLGGDAAAELRPAGRRQGHRLDDELQAGFGAHADLVAVGQDGLIHGLAVQEGPVAAQVLEDPLVAAALDPGVLARDHRLGQDDVAHRVAADDRHVRGHAQRPAFLGAGGALHVGPGRGRRHRAGGRTGRLAIAFFQRHNREFLLNAPAHRIIGNAGGQPSAASEHHKDVYCAVGPRTHRGGLVLACRAGTETRRAPQVMCGSSALDNPPVRLRMGHMPCTRKG